MNVHWKRDDTLRRVRCGYFFIDEKEVRRMPKLVYLSAEIVYMKVTTIDTKEEAKQLLLRWLSSIPDVSYDRLGFCFTGKICD